MTVQKPPLLAHDSGVDLDKAEGVLETGAKEVSTAAEGHLPSFAAEATNIDGPPPPNHPESNLNSTANEQPSIPEPPGHRSSAPKTTSPSRTAGIRRPQTQGATRVVTAMFSKSGLRFVEIPKDAGKPPLVPTRNKQKTEAAAEMTSVAAKPLPVEVAANVPVAAAEVSEIGSPVEALREEHDSQPKNDELFISGTHLLDKSESVEEACAEGDLTDGGEDAESQHNESALSEDSETEERPAVTEPAAVPISLSCILDHDFSSGELSGWSAEGDGELTAFHLIRRNPVPEPLPPTPRAGLNTPETCVPRWRGANHSLPKTSNPAQGLHFQSLQYHPLAKGGYTTTSSWRYRKGSGDDLGSGADSEYIMKGAVRMPTAEPPTYRDGYLIDANLPLRYNFIHPPLPASVGAVSESSLVAESTSQSDAAPVDRPRSSPPQQTSSSTTTLGAAATGLSTVHAFPFAEEVVERDTEPLPHGSQSSNKSDGFSGTDQAATQWRHQRVKAAMTMKELKKVFPPLMKQYMHKAGCSNLKPALDSHQYPTQRDGTATAAERPISRRGPPQKLRLRHGGSKRASSGATKAQYIVAAP
ncbi:hypothetical protein HDU87_000669 [Geranomyces variabilis]|uniref:Uncharacterized protein n=1 Tax=Geranomyces variabilis TaxID=109894 RepID=A0AAD5TEE1_9FUNG|nr:hypothetical protein HDU87_000669 [Geranomyces variabilis]